MTTRGTDPSQIDGARPSSPAEAERDVERSRAELAQTLEALSRRLATRHLVEKGIDMVTDNLAGHDVLNRSLDMIRANPVPIALIGIGAAWLLAANSKIIPEERVDAARRRIVGAANDIGSRAGELAAALGDRIGLGGEAGSDQPLGHTGNPIVDQTGSRRMNGWLHQVVDITQGALHSARDSGETMLHRAGDAGDQLTASVERNPLLMGAIGVMIGALVGALLPLTRTETDLLGGSEVPRKAAEPSAARVHDVASRAGGAADALAREADKPSQL
jgi:hypothetical protein